MYGFDVERDSTNKIITYEIYGAWYISTKLNYSPLEILFTITP
jgi:hypothetical protein